MADFNPDAYLATPPAQSGGFDPDAYLASAPAEKPGVLSRIGAAIGGALTGTAEMAGLTAPVEMFEYGVMGRQPAAHFPVAGPYGATDAQVREVERQSGETRKAVQQAGGVVPFVMQGITQPFQKIGQAFTKPPQTLGEAYDVGKAVPQAAATLQAGKSALGALGGAAARIPGVAEQAGKIAAAGRESMAVRAAEQAPVNVAVEKATKAGFKLPPSQAGGPTGKILEGVGGKIQTEMKLSRDNAVNTNKLAAREIGLSDRQPITEANLGRLKQTHFDVYKRVASKGRISADDEFRTELRSALDRTADVAVDYPEDYNEKVQTEINKFDKPSANASSMLDRIKSLRERAGRNMKSLSADDFELGLAQKKIATAMENLIERSVAETDPTLIKDFRNARTQLAKIYGVEEAVGPSGNVTAAILARQLKRGVPLSGGLRDIAETYMEFPKVMRSVEGLGGHAPFSALDYLVGGVEAAANPAAAMKIAGALVGRPLAREIIASKSYQRAAIKPRPPQPSLATRVAEKVNEQARRGQTLQSLLKEQQQ